MKQNFPKIWVLGASFETSNMGVNALAESSIKCIFTKYPNAEVILRTVERGKPLEFTFHGQEFKVKKKNMWFSKNLLKPNNIYTLLIYSLLLKIMPLAWLKEKFKTHNPTFKEITEADLVVDITAGDSFSDIYGMRILMRHSWTKWLFILCEVPLVMLPQTYGPFKSRFAKKIAQYLLKRTTAIYSRDKQGVELVNNLLGKAASQKNIQFIPDVAFVLDPEKFEHPIIAQLENAKQNEQMVIGLNISGLLYHKGQQAQSQFDLKCDYQELVGKILHLLIKYPNTLIVLIPHVFTQGQRFESDPEACRQVHQQFIGQYPNRILLVEETLSHKQVKYLISLTDFFIGSRMHSCIAAISQNVPALGIAYSLKFQGVFESVGVGNSVIDLRIEEEQRILARIQEAFQQRQETAEQLRVTIPKIQEKVLGLFEGIHTTIG
jgi:colanic acid/amylovoran biosynthesis protein